MLELYLIRHAESEMNKNHAHLVGGRSNKSPLTEHGITQALRLGARLQSNGIEFTSVYTSTAVRAIDTARHACAFVGYTIEDMAHDERLCELGQGDWEKKLRSEVYTAEQLDIINKDPWNFKPPGGESQREVAERMHAYINGIVRENTKRGKVAIFSHGIAIRCYLAELMNWDKPFTYLSTTENTSISEVTFLEGGQPKLVRINDAAHLEPSPQPL